jgi:hypothetical protein
MASNDQCKFESEIPWWDLRTRSRAKRIFDWTRLSRQDAEALAIALRKRPGLTGKAISSACAGWQAEEIPERIGVPD